MRIPWDMLNSDLTSTLEWHWAIAPEEITSQVPSGDFKDAEVKILVEWLEKYAKRSTHKPPKTRFLEYITAHRLVFNAEKDTSILEGPCGKHLKQLHLMWKEVVKDNNNYPSSHEEAGMANKIIKGLTVVGCKSEAVEIFTAKIQSKIHDLWLLDATLPEEKRTSSHRSESESDAQKQVAYVLKAAGGISPSHQIHSRNIGHL